jgi:hypothetical protein
MALGEWADINEPIQPFIKLGYAFIKNARALLKSPFIIQRSLGSPKKRALIPLKKE